jgi:hypothetical protein
MLPAETIQQTAKISGLKLMVVIVKIPDRIARPGIKSGFKWF